MSSSSTAPTISRFPVPELADAPEDLRTFIQDVADKSGFVPNIFLASLHRPEECRARSSPTTPPSWTAGAVSPRPNKEMIIVATSAAGDCPYCVVSHSAVLRIRAKNPLIAD
jgi:uncharacterized peroxidase-related enzyme